MACCPFPRPTSFQHHHRSPHVPPPFYNSTTATANLMTFFSPLSSSSSKTNLHRSFPLKRIPWSGRCHAAGPQPEPPSEEQLSPLSGVKTTFTRFQDTLQIFFAVLFWISLFFWSSAWDRGNGGRPNNGPRFRK
ncbi:hypothetical protein ABFS83_09G088000 [Erythranthe nasuta]